MPVDLDHLLGRKVRILPRVVGNAARYANEEAKVIELERRGQHDYITHLLVESKDGEQFRLGTENNNIIGKEYVLLNKPEEMKKFTAKELGTTEDIICHIISKEQWDKLRPFCPNMQKYDSRYTYYRTSEAGVATERDRWVFEDYKTVIIEFDQIDFGTVGGMKIIGYKAPKAFTGTTDYVEKGTIFNKREGEFFYHNQNAPNCTPVRKNPLPKEIVEDWEPVYEEEYKLGDYVFVTGESLRSATAKETVGKVLKIIRIPSNENYVISNHKYKTESEKGATCKGLWKDEIRKATPEEIKKNAEIKIGTYEAEFKSSNSVTFGCQTFTKSELEAIRRIIGDTINGSLRIAGQDITVDLLDKILNRLS